MMKYLQRLALLVNAELLSRKDAEIEELRRMLIVQQLDYTRHARELIAHFLTFTDDVDIRQQLIAGVMDLGDEIARLEEHVA